MIDVRKVDPEKIKSLMLWKDDFKNEWDWKTICKVLDLPEDTQEIGMNLWVWYASPYKRTHGKEKV